MRPGSGAAAASPAGDVAASARLGGLRNDPTGAAGALALYCRMLAALSANVGAGYRETQHALDFSAAATTAPSAVTASAHPEPNGAWRLTAATPLGVPLASGTTEIDQQIAATRQPIPARADLDSDLGLYGLALGDTACLVRRYAAADVDAYLALTTDSNPWLSSASAPGMPKTPGRLLPGALLCALLGVVLEQRFVGYRLRWLRQRMAFGVPARSGDDLSATVTITRLHRHNAQAEIAGLIAGTDGRYILTGTILVQVVPMDAT